MKLIVLVCVCAVLSAGCATKNTSRSGRVGQSSTSSGGIDPVTMAGIEQSNANAAEQARATSQAGIDQANAAAAQAATDAANAASAANH